VHGERALPRVPVHGVREPLERQWVPVVARHEVHQTLQPLQRRGLDVVQRCLDAVADVFAQLLGVPVGAGHADHGHGELTALDEPVERGEDHLAGEVTGDSEEHQYVRTGAGVLRSEIGRCGVGGRHSALLSMCPPNSLRCADCTLSAKISLPREANRL
jgi:hypothetical protein